LTDIYLPSITLPNKEGQGGGTMNLSARNQFSGTVMVVIKATEVLVATN
jgi:hypothetical protein